MSRWLYDAFNEIGAMLIGFVVIFSTMKIILDPKTRELKRALAVYFISVPTGVLVGLVLKEWEMGDVTSIALGCVGCLVAERAVLFIMGFQFEKLIKEWIKKRLK